MAALGWAALFLGLGFAFLGRGGEFRGHPPRPELVRALLRRPSLPVLAALFVLGVGASFGPYSVLPLFLVDERGLSSSLANQLLALSRVTGPAVAFIAGWTADRVGAKRSLMLFMGLSSVATVLLGVVRGPLLPAVVIVQPLLTVCFFPVAFSAISRIFEARERSVAISLITACGVLGGSGLVPAGLGLLGDQGAFGTGFVILGCLLAASLLLLRSLEVPRPAQP
jgi:NNP family nitrate/nitrite transporter-like MFS transporter